MKNDIEIIDAERESITYDQMLKCMAWSWGEEGVTLAKIWQGLNVKHFGGSLTPLPIWMPSTFPYGGAIGLFCANHQRESLHIQIKQNLSLQEKVDVLFHEMIHQTLSETRRNTSHNALPWCGEIMRLAKEIWDVEIWAAPSLPRKVDGKSKRIQKPSPAGIKSIERRAIATFPHSLELSISIDDYL
jgi:hypothetical protein